MNRRGFVTSGAALAFGGLYAGLAFEGNRLVREQVRVPVQGLPEGLEHFKIVALSDFHLHPFTQLDFLRKAFSAARALRPDLIVLLGDFVDSTVDAIDELGPALSDLNARHGVFAVLGNHDFRKGPTIVERGLVRQGVEVLRNRGVGLSVGKHSLWLGGLDSYLGVQSLPAALSGRKDGEVTILMCHEPDIADDIAEDGRVHLQLSGHSHGGQINIPGLVESGLPPMGRKYAFGSYGIRDLFLHTNRGLGMTTVPFRFRSAPEVSEILLVRKDLKNNVSLPSNKASI